MSNRAYPVHRTPTIAWVLVYDASVHRWIVETQMIEPDFRLRLPLEEFEQTSTGQDLADKLQKAVEHASLDF